MTNKEYITLAMRTETPLDPLKKDIDAGLLWTSKRGALKRLLHSALGCADDAGELVKRIKDRLFYNKPIDAVNLKEEYGDLLWCIAQGLDALGSSFEEVMEMNIAKLQARYPDKFTEDAAINRDLDAEREALETLFWEGSPVTECQLCHGTINQQFINGKRTPNIRGGAWAIMCPTCFGFHGVGLGEGRGQLYELQGGRYVKIKG